MAGFNPGILGIPKVQQPPAFEVCPGAERCDLFQAYAVLAPASAPLLRRGSLGWAGTWNLENQDLGLVRTDTMQSYVVQSPVVDNLNGILDLYIPWGGTWNFENQLTGVEVSDDYQLYDVQSPISEVINGQSPIGNSWGGTWAFENNSGPIFSDDFQTYSEEFPASGTLAGSLTYDLPWNGTWHFEDL